MVVVRSLRRDTLRLSLFVLALVVGAAAHAANDIPRVNTSRPAGFDSLLQPQEAIADVVMGGRLLGQARVRYSPGKVTVLDVDALVALLPDLLDPAAIRAALAMPDLDSHPGMVCRANTDAERAACGIYHPAVAGVVFDDQRFRLDVYVHPGLLAVHPVATRGYLPRPQPGVSLVDRFGGSIAGSGGDAFYGLQNRAILAEGAARLRTDLSFSSYEGLTVDTLAAELDRPGVRYAAGALWVPGIELIGRRRLIGAGVASQVDTRLDRTSIAGTPLIVSLPLRARVDIIRDGRLLTSRNYEAGNQALDTTSLPDGSYEVVLHIEEIGGTAHDERRFFTKNVAIAAIGEPIFFAYGGLLGRNRRNAPFATSGTPLYLAGIARRFSPHLALDASVMGTDRTGLLELGGYHLGQAAQVRLAGLVSVHRDAGVLFQASSSGVARLNYTIDARRVWSHDDRPLIPLGEDGGDYGGIAVDRTAQLAAGSFTQVNATISYNLKPGQIGVTGSYRRDPRAGRSYAIGPTLYWPLVERAAVQVNLRGDMTVSNHGSSVFIGLTFQRVRARSSLTASLGARATSATSDNHDAAVIGAVGGSWHRPDVLGGDATLAGDVEREVSGTLVRGRADLAARHATLDVDVAQPIAGHDGATQYGINFQTMAAVTSSGIALQGRDQNDSILRVAVQGAPRGAPFEILVDNAARGIVHAGTETSIAVAPYRQYAVRIRSVGGDIIQFDGNTRLVSVYPGNVGRLVWSARRVVAMFGRAVWADGTPVADAAVYVAGAIGGTDGDGYFQIEAGSDDVLKIQSPDGRTCRLPLSARPAALGYAALGTLTCPRPSPPMQFAVSKP